MSDLKSIEVAHIMGLTKRMINMKCQNGDFPNAYKSGNRWMIPEKDLSNFGIKTGNKKYFNTVGACVSKKHYMVNLDNRLSEIKRLVDKGYYFSINKARQFGKTTTLMALADYLAKDYVVVSLDFQMQMSSSSFATEEKFVRAFYNALKDSDLGRYFKEDEHCDDMIQLFKFISRVCSRVDKEVVLMIDEVDSATNNQVFTDFLSQLRGYYLHKESMPIFKSVILVGVYDIKNIQRRIRPDEEHRENSPWNIAADFNIPMDFSIESIQGMLEEYRSDKGLTFNSYDIAREIFDYTGGYPYLVSRVCQKLDENVNIKEWTLDNTRETVGIIIREQNTLFEDMARKLKDFPLLKKMIQDILFQGKLFPFNINNDMIALGVMFGFLKDENGHVSVSNRIFEVWFYNLFISEEATNSKTYDSGLYYKKGFINGNQLNMDLILSKFVEHFSESFTGNDDRFIEENGRRLFLLYIRPIINGVGNYYIESRTRSMGRTDLIIDYLGNRYIIEMKIWHGNQYNEEGEEQLKGYLNDYNVKKGYMLSFNFNKNKKVGITEHHFKDATIVEAVV